jgi:glutaconate CoA-transferase subunit B
MSQGDIINFELRGHGLFQFLRPLQIDPFGNVNASVAVRPDGSVIRFHGIAVGDAINFVRRTCLYVTEHTPRVFTERLAYRTGTGHHDGSSWRGAHGIPNGGPESVVTPLAVLGFDQRFRLEIRSLHPGVTLDEVHAATGFELGVSSDLHETPPPTTAELETLERVDPEGIRRLEFREGRAAVLRRLEARPAGDDA